MAIGNHVAATGRSGIRRADMVFVITDPPMTRRPRPIGHAGIALEDIATYSRGQPVRVVHMASRFVCEQTWQPETRVPLAVDVSAAIDDLEDLERDDVISAAASFCRPVTLLDSETHGCYWQGDPSPTAHVDHPNAQDAYAFSCTTFVQHCYAPVRGDLVDPGRPVVTPDERSLLQALNLRTQQTVFRRLSCGQLICALEQVPQRFPYTPVGGDWASCDDITTFARLVRATTPTPT